jgi:hypothetical protein
LGFGYLKKIPGKFYLIGSGLRNPWRCSVDKMSNRIFCGDVGQNEWEEISIVKAGVEFINKTREKIFLNFFF